MSHPRPTAKVQGALIEDLTIAGRQEMRGEDDKRVGPDQEGVFHTPPLVIIEMTLK